MFILFARMGGTQLLFSDGDTGWHIRTGEWILSHQSVPTVDLFSFTKPNAPWFAWEWAWDVASALIHRFTGLAGLGFVTTLMLGVFSLLVYRLALRVSQNNLASIAVTAVACAISSIHWLARPHLVSWIFTLLFLHELEAARAKKAGSAQRLLIVLPVISMFWANLHGGFVAGLLVVGCYALGEAFTAAIGANRSDPRVALEFAWRSSAIYWQSLALCGAATLMNPYGWQLHEHILAYLSDSELLDKIAEFQSISFHVGPAIFFEAMLLLAVCAVVENLRVRQYTPVLLICTWSHCALVSARHIPLFAIVAAPFAAAFLSKSIDRIREIPLLAVMADNFSDVCLDLRKMELTPRLHLASAGPLLLLAGLFAVGQAPFVPQFNPETFPTQAINVIESHPGCRIFTTDQWGDYFLYKLYPAERVFFDGRSDFYGNDFVKVNQRIASAEHDWKLLLQRFAVNVVVMKPETPLSAALKLTPGSQVLFDDGKVIVFDIGGIYQTPSPRVSRISKNANRASSFPQGLRSACEQVAWTLNLSKQSQKGKHNDHINIA